MSEKNTTAGRITFFGLLGIAFIVLKLCGVIDWAWWIVLSPIWAPIAAVAIAFVVLFIIAWIRG